MNPSKLARIASQLSSATAIAEAVESQQARRDGPQREYVAPSDPLEESVAEIWTRLLRVERVGRTDDFFLLGGHSLLATQMISRVSEVVGIQLPLVEIFANSTLDAFAKVIRFAVSAGESTVQVPLVRVGGSARAPLSYGQQRLWFLDQLEPNSSFYNVPMAMRLTGPFDAAAMELALVEVVARHESLRTRFQLQGEEPVQVVAAEIPLPLTQVDLSDLPAEEREDEARGLVGAEARRSFNLAVGPLFRVLIVKLGPEEHVLLLNLHHAISDGWSLGVLMNDLTALYEGYRSGSPVQLPALPLAYGDYAIWQRKYLEGGALEQQLGYWKKNMAGAPASIQLPTDRVRPPVQTFQGSKRIAVFPSELLDGLKALSRAEGATLFITLVSAFNVLLGRYSGQQDLVVGTAIAGRRHPETERLIGFFANTLVLRTDLSGEPTFRELLHRVRETTLSAYANQDVPFEKLVEELNPVRDMSRSPLFQVMIIQQNAFQRSNGFGSLKALPYSAAGGTAKVDLLLNVSDGGGDLRCVFEYNTDLYDAATIDRMLENYEALLEQVVGDASQRVSEMSLLRAEQRRKQLVEWNATAAEYPRDKCIHQLIEEQVARTPDTAAVIFGSGQLNYRELNGQANQLACYLMGRGVKSGDRVGIYLERSLSLMVVLLAVQKCGAAYVPLDPAYPAERLRLVVEDADLACVVTLWPLQTGMPEYNGTVICIDRESEAIAAAVESDLGLAANPEDSMYVIFTSGSTGRPKGVEVPHRGVVNLLAWMAKELHMGPGNVFPALASFAFDMSVPELYLALVSGGTVLLAERHLASNGEELAALLTKHHATVVHATPTTWGLLLEAGFTGAGLKRCVGAELLPRELFGRLMKAAEGTPLYNLYGPTETTVWSTFHRFASADEAITVGRPLANTQVYLLDENLQPVPVGVPGGIYISGDGVTKGYFGRPELTAEKFLPNPFAAGGKLYCTGDVGRYLADGRIEYIERADTQVKLRGFRIELGEIEAVLASHPAVRECVVIAREDQPGNKFLAAYVVGQYPTAQVDTAELRAYLKQRLPDYMVPTGWLGLQRLPLSANGKVDRKNLPIPDALAPKGGSEKVPRTPVEIRLASIWEATLNVSPIRLDDDFFNIGGHSLLAVQMMAKAREAFGCELPLTLLFSAPRLGDLAKEIQTERGKQPFKALIPIRKTGTKPPLFCVSRPNVNALGFIVLARHLSSDQPVIGLQTQMDKDGSSWVFDQVDYEQKAREYIQILRESYPDGPYFLTGYCEGAHIAFEMARQLEQMNLPVGMIAILDAWPVENTVNRTKYILRNYWREFRKRRRKIFSARWNALTAFLSGRPAPIPVAVPIQSAPQDDTQRKLITQQIEKRYWPGPDFVPPSYPGRLTLFRTKKQKKIRINDYKMGWGQRALGGVDVYPIGGAHVVLLREPSVIDVAKHMQECMDRALSEYPHAEPTVDIQSVTADVS
jgi:amino acid adenylation domain-containing protein